MSSLSLSQSLELAQAALASGRRQEFKPLTVAVLDAGGHLVVLLREDHSSLLRPEIAVGKAWGVLGLGFGGRELARRADKTPQFFAALSDMSGGRMVPVPGGVLVRDTSGAIIGSVGISGDTSANDEICAIEAIEAIGLIADAG